MNVLIELCEACRTLPFVCTVNSEEPEQPYHLCEECTHRLLTFSLRPLEWFRLAAIHGTSQYYLHDDFYFENGIAQNPQEAVLSPELFPAPTLEQASQKIDTLIDYTITRHHLTLEDEVLHILRQQDPLQLLKDLKQRLSKGQNSEIEARAYEISAMVLGKAAETWIRERWNVYLPHAFSSLVIASAACLPLEEGFHLATQALETMPQKEMRSACSVLAYFRTEKTLDWLETHVHSPVTDAWGRLAAVSQLSWPRVIAWLDQGRPLSLVALDALKACLYYDTPLLHRFAPELQAPASKEVMAATLEQYAVRDPVPRVRQTIATIINVWEKAD